MYVCVQEDMCKGVCRYVRMHVYVGQRPVFSVFFEGLPLKLELTEGTKKGGKAGASGSSYFEPNKAHIIPLGRRRYSAPSFKFNWLNVLSFMCTGVSACRLSTTWAHGAHGGQKGESDPLELELQSCEPPCVGRNWTQILCKSNQFSELPS